MAIDNSASRRRTYEVQKSFLEDNKSFWIVIFLSSLLHSITAEVKKELWKKLCFNMNRRILLVFLVLYVLKEAGTILIGILDIDVWQSLKKSNTVSDTFSIFNGSEHDSD